MPLFARKLARIAAVVLCLNGLWWSYAVAQQQQGQGKRPRQLDDVYEAVAARVPGFAGILVDENGNEVLLLVDSSQAAAADKEVDAAFEKRNRKKPRAVKVVRYNFLELRAWYRPLQQLVGTHGVVLSDIDEANNRILLGVDGLDREQEVRRIIGKLGVPPEVVHIEQMKPEEPRASLLDYVRPLAGGLQIMNDPDAPDGQAICSLGFTAASQGIYGFVTASHCNAYPFSSYGAGYFYQPDSDEINGWVGLGYLDSAGYAAEGCAPGGVCRYSDSTFVAASYQAVAQANTGLIASGMTFSSFYLTNQVTLNCPPVGTWVTMVGRTTGLSQATITATDVTRAQTDTAIVFLNQCVAAFSASPGDSGSPVFLANQNGLANLAGVLWGASGTYSPLGGVQADLGELSDFTGAYAPPKPPPTPSPNPPPTQTKVPGLMSQIIEFLNNL